MGWWLWWRLGGGAPKSQAPSARNNKQGFSCLNKYRGGREQGEAWRSRGARLEEDSLLSQAEGSKAGSDRFITSAVCPPL